MRPQTERTDQAPVNLAGIDVAAKVLCKQLHRAGHGARLMPGRCLSMALDAARGTERLYKEV